MPFTKYPAHTTKFQAYVRDTHEMCQVTEILFSSLSDTPHKIRVQGDQRVLRVGRDADLREYSSRKSFEGQDIYEGDILVDSDYDAYRGVVRFETIDLGCNDDEYSYVITGWCVEPLTREISGEILTNMMNRGDLTILGNIYQHPHLLSQEER